jgi:hypothetical protein
MAGASALWHGDVTTTARRHILRDPPDCLLITPESLEVMLVSPNVDSRGLFCNLRVVIVDEIHGFAGDDRGRTRWKGQGQCLSFGLCQAIQRVLAGDGTQPWWSQRAQDRLREIRGEYAWLRPQGSVVVASPDSGTESL